MKKPLARKTTKKVVAQDLFQKLLEESMRDETNLELVSQLLHDIHSTRDKDAKSRKKKLRNKDRALVNLIQKIRGDRNALLPAFPAFGNFFIHLLAALETIEAILWELKGEKGPVPNPGEPPEE
jgi:hypothetical protein